MQQGISRAVSIRRPFVRAAVALLAVGIVGTAEAAFAGDTGPQPAAPGMRLYRDPVTGRIGAPPPGAVIDQPALRAEEAEPSSEQHLTEQLPPGPGGGVRLKLNGRFRAVVRRQVGPAGAVHECVEGGAAANE